MNLFFPYPEPIKVAECLTDADLRREVENLEKAVKDGGQHKEWYDRARLSMEHYLFGDMEPAVWWSHHADLVRPDFLTPEFCDAEKARLYKRSPKKYAQFHDYCNGEAAGGEEA